MNIRLASLKDTALLAKELADILLQSSTFPALLLQGNLGSGKTTLTGMLVPLLPGGDEAEVSSPSFTVMNIYPTQPETVHFDFYRTQGLGLDGTMEEYFYDTGRLCIAEWINYLPETLWPEEYVLLSWAINGAERTLALTAQGRLGEHVLNALKQQSSLTITNK